MGKLWHSGTIFTMNKPMETVEAILTQNGVIVAAGDETEIRTAYSTSITEEHDLEGKFMYPGFVDSHLHIIGHGEKLMRLDLSSMTSPEEMVRALTEYAEQLPPGEWLIGEGWNENLWKDTSIPHRKDLDLITSKHPMMLTRVCRHAMLVNSKALEMGSITNDTKDPQGGKIVRDNEGIPTGYLHDTAQDLIKNVMPEIKQSYLEKAIQLAVEDLLKKGIVGGHSEDLSYYGSFARTHQAFLNSINGENTKFRAHLLVHHEVVQDMIDLGNRYKSGTEYVEFGAMKIFSDGAIGGRTAWLSESYEDDPGNFGMPIHEDTKLKQLVMQARSFDLPVAVHAIGDQAVEAITEAIIEHPPTEQSGRDRIIHAQFLKENQYEKIKQSGAVIDIQPTFVSSDFPWVIERIGENRLEHAYPWKQLIDYGIPCAGGSDAPIEEVDPLLGIKAAVLRKSDYDQKVYGKKEQLSMFEAISLYTSGSAYAIEEENNRGEIQVGFTADFTVLDQNLFTIDPERINDVNVELTIVDGDIMYKR